MMIEAHILLLTIAYAVLGALLLVILTHLPVPRPAKVVAIGVMSVFNIGVFFWSQGLVGWSSATAVPERFQLLWARVVEPNPSRGVSGAIHLWVEALDERNIPSGEPRAFLLPYSTSLATKAAAAQAEIKKGNAQGGKAGAADLIPDIGMSATEGAAEGVNIRTISQGATPGGDPSGGGVLDPAALGGQSKSVDLIPLPKPLLPPKDYPPMEGVIP
jgi:hypothetical protein